MNKTSIFRDAKSALLVLIACNGVLSVQAAEPFESSQNQKQNTIVSETSPLIIVTHVDVIPTFTNSATNLLLKYRLDSLKDAGAKRVQILQQVGRPNHYSVVEEWDNQHSYDVHVGAASSKEFRANLQPMLGAPFDERPHHSLE